MPRWPGHQAESRLVLPAHLTWAKGWGLDLIVWGWGTQSGVLDTVLESPDEVHDTRS